MTELGALAIGFVAGSVIGGLYVIALLWSGRR